MTWHACMHARRLTTDDDGMARNTFWITDRRGNKLSNYHAELLAERVGDFVVYCTPDQKVPRLIWPLGAFEGSQGFGRSLHWCSSDDAHGTACMQPPCSHHEPGEAYCHCALRVQLSTTLHRDCYQLLCGT